MPTIMIHSKFEGRKKNRVTVCWKKEGLEWNLPEGYGYLSPKQRCFIMLLIDKWNQKKARPTKDLMKPRKTHISDFLLLFARRTPTERDRETETETETERSRVF